MRSRPTSVFLALVLAVPALLVAQEPLPPRRNIPRAPGDTTSPAMRFFVARPDPELRRAPQGGPPAQYVYSPNSIVLGPLQFSSPTSLVMMPQPGWWSEDIRRCAMASGAGDLRGFCPKLWLSAPVALPDSTVLTKVYLIAWDAGAARDTTLWATLIRYDYSSWATSNPPTFRESAEYRVLARVESTPRGNVTATTDISFPTVDRSKYMYFVQLGLPNNLAEDGAERDPIPFAFYAVVIQYQYLSGP